MWRTNPGQVCHQPPEPKAMRDSLNTYRRLSVRMIVDTLGIDKTLDLNLKVLIGEQKKIREAVSKYLLGLIKKTSSFKVTLLRGVKLGRLSMNLEYNRKAAK